MRPVAPRAGRPTASRRPDGRMDGMVALRSRRLETLLGSRIDDVTHAQVSGLVTNQVVEAFDLDYKSRLYGRADADKRDLAGDVAALANTAGGLIVLGIEEDDQARATAAPGVALSDGEVTRMLQVVASLTAPLPVFDIVPVEDPARPGTGFYLIAVPRSPRQPHCRAGERRPTVPPPQRVYHALPV